MSEENSVESFYSAFPERRINPFRPELRSDNGQPGRIIGYASVFEKISRNLGGFIEKVNRRAFSNSKIAGWEDVVCRFNHNDDFLLGTIRGGTLALDFDETGLSYDVLPPDARKDILELCRRGDVGSSSFAFRVPEGGDDWGLTDWNTPLRTLLNVELVDVAPVTTPAYPDATAAARSVDGAIMSLSCKFDADPTEIRSLLDSKQAPKLFKRSDRPSVPIVPDVTETPKEEPMSSLTGQNASFYEELRKDFDKDTRDKLSKSGAAMPDGSFPIQDEDDLHNAVKLAGHAKDPAAAKAHIRKRAKALGKSDAIPDDWDSEEKKSLDEATEVRADAAKADDADADKDDDATDKQGDEDAEDGDEDESGKGVEGERSDETEAEERTEEAPAAEEHQPAGTTDHGHKVYDGDENRRRLTELLGKRYDPYPGQGED